MNNLKEERVLGCGVAQPMGSCNCKEEPQSVTALREINAMLTEQLKKLVSQVGKDIEDVRGVGIKDTIEAESILVSTIIAVDDQLRIREGR